MAVALTGRPTTRWNVIFFLILLGLPATVFAAPPQFDASYGSATFNVGEDEGSPHVINTLTATDADNDSLTFSITANDGGPFEISVSGLDLQTNGSLDYETKTSYSVTLRVTANSEFDEVTVTIAITDVNDNPPVLTSTDVDQTIDEEQSIGNNPGFSFSASDVDTNEVLTYELSGTDSSHFNIDNLLGTVTLKTQVDVDSTPGTAEIVYKPLLTVFDNGKTHSATATLSLTITDINDNTPACTNYINYVNLAENSDNGGAAIVTLTCSDDDSATGNNNVLAYTMVPPHADFSVSNAGAITVDNAQDYEATKLVTLEIEVADTPATGVLSVTATVHIVVTGENDVDPVWGAISPTPDSTSPDTYNVGENIAIGTSVFTVAATDGDDDVGNDIIYSIVSVSDGTNPVTGAFTIDPTSGEVTTQAAFDRDGAISEYTLSLQVIFME